MNIDKIKCKQNCYKLYKACKILGIHLKVQYLIAIKKYRKFKVLEQSTV